MSTDRPIVWEIHWPFLWTVSQSWWPKGCTPWRSIPWQKVKKPGASFTAIRRNCSPAMHKMVKYAGPAVQKLTKIPMPGDVVFDELTNLLDKLERMQALEGYFNKWIDLQEEGLEEIYESFRDIPVFTLELQSRELLGIPVLTEAVQLVYENRDPMEIFFKDQIMYVEKKEDEWILKLSLPFAQKDEMELAFHGDELVLHIKNEKRRFLVPDSLKGRDVTGAKFEDGWLKVRFGLLKLIRKEIVTVNSNKGSAPAANCYSIYCK